MLISARPIRMLVESMAESGLDVDRILSSLEIDRARLASDAHTIPWSKFVLLCNAASAAVSDDPERLRMIGRTMTKVPSFAPVQRLGRAVLSVRAIYRIAFRWVGRANFPHVRLYQRFEGDRIFIHGYIPPAYEGSEAFHHISAGSMEALPTVMGLPPCERIDFHVDPRSADLELRMPRESALARGLHAVGSVLRWRDRAEILERERTVLAAGLDASFRARDELRTVLEAIPALVVIHADGKIVFANRALLELLGWSAEELIGRPLIDSIAPRARAQFLDRIQRAAPGLTYELHESWLLTRTGEPVRIEVSPAQSIILDGAPARLVVGRDLHEQDRLQSQLATADRLAAVGLLAAGVAHEVNNPLAYLLNNIEIAQRQLVGVVDAEPARTALTVALEGAHRIRFIVRELLLLAREDAAPVSPTDLAAVVESTVALARVEIERTARLELSIEPVPPIRGSVARVAQIVLNLVLNSLEAMRGRAGGVLTIRIRPGAGRRVVLEVEDNGVGVAAADAGQIFLPFFTTKPAGHGTGLGLAVTQRLVTELGGEISFTSDPGRGTIFRVSFPVSSEGSSHVSL